MFNFFLYLRKKTKEDPQMDQEKKNAIALIRYSVIAPLITGLSDDYDSLTAFFNAASVKGVILPDGTIKHEVITRLFSFTPAE